MLAVGERLWSVVDDRLRRMTTGLAGGVGCSEEELCGALSGGTLIIGSLHGRTSPDANDDECQRLACPEDRSPTMAHASDPADLMVLAAELYENTPRAYLVTVRGVSFDLQPDRLSPSVQSVVNPAARMILSVLEHELDDNPRRADPVNA